MALDPFTIAGAGAGLLSSLFGDDGGGTTTQNINRTETRTPRYKGQTDWYASILPSLLEYNMTKKNPAATPNPIQRMVWQAIAQKTGQQPMVDAVTAWKPAEVDPFKFQSYRDYQKEKGIGPYKPNPAPAASTPAPNPYGGLPRGLDPSIYDMASQNNALKNLIPTRRAMGGPVRGNAIMSAMMQQGAKPYIVGDGTGDPNAIEILLQKGDGYVIKNEDVPPAIKNQVAMGKMGPMMRRLGGGTTGGGLYQKYDPAKTQAAVTQKAASDYQTYGTGTPPATPPALTYDNSMSQGVKNLATNFMGGGQNVKADPITGAKVGSVANITAPTMQAATVAPVSDIKAPTLAPVSDMTASIVNYTPQGMTDRAYLDKVMSDEYLNTDNPYMTSLKESLRADSDAALKDQLAMSGRGDNTYAALRQGRAVGDANRGFTNTIANMLASDYDKRRALQMQGLGYSTDFDKFTGAQGLEKATADATFGQSANLANMQKGLDMSKTQAGFDYSAEEANQGKDLQTALQEAIFGQDANKTTAGYKFAAEEDNQKTALQKALADAGYDQRTGEFNANLGLDAQTLNTKNLLSGAGLAGVADNMDWRAIEAMNAVGTDMTNRDVLNSDQGEVANSDLILDPKTGKYIKRKAAGGFVGGPNASMAFIADLLDKIQGRYGKTRVEGTDATTMPETSPNPIASALSGGMAAYGLFGGGGSPAATEVNPFDYLMGESNNYIPGRAEGGPVGTIDPFRQALIAAGFRGLGNKGGNLATILGDMGSTGLDAYNSATDRAFKQRQLEQERERLNLLLNETIKENQSQKALRDAQIGAMGIPSPTDALNKIKGLKELENLERTGNARSMLGQMTSPDFNTWEPEVKQALESAIYEADPKVMGDYKADVDRKQAQADSLQARKDAHADNLQLRKEMNNANLELRKTMVDINRQKDSEKGLPGETAGKLAMATSAVRDLEQATNLLFPNGTDKPLDAAALTESKIPVIGGLNPKAERFRSYLKNAIAAKLRVETGAAATQSEVNDIYDRFAPKMVDIKNPAVALEKLNRLMANHLETISYIDPTGKYLKRSKSGGMSTVPKQGKTSSNNRFTVREVQ